MSSHTPRSPSFARRWLWRSIWVIGCLLLSYPLVSIVCLAFPRNADFANNGEVLIYVLDNGVHSDLMLPASNAQHDWRTEFALANFPTRTPREPDWVLIGWGDAEFYLHTPSWADLSPGTAVRALSGRNPSVLHVAFHADGDFEGMEKWPLRLSTAQYQRLIAFVKQSSLTHPASALPGFHYGSNDAFFQASGHYTLFTTCNTWTGDALATSGVRVSPWTPFVWNLRASLPNSLTN